MSPQLPSGPRTFKFVQGGIGFTAEYTEHLHCVGLRRGPALSADTTIKAKADTTESQWLGVTCKTRCLFFRKSTRMWVPFFYLV